MTLYQDYSIVYDKRAVLVLPIRMVEITGKFSCQKLLGIYVVCVTSYQDLSYFPELSNHGHHGPTLKYRMIYTDLNGEDVKNLKQLLGTQCFNIWYVAQSSGLQ